MTLALWVPEGLPRDLTFGVYPDSGMVTQQEAGYSWKATLGKRPSPPYDGCFSPEAFRNHGTRCI